MEYRTLPPATLGQAWNSFWGNLFNFTGRSTRAEYWWITLLIFAANSILALPMALLPVIGTSLLTITVAALTLALYVRRFHDVGLPTWAAISAVLGQLVTSLSALTLLALGFLPSVTDDTFDPEKLRTDLLVSGILLLLISLMVYVFVLIVTLLPSKGPNQYGPQRAGRVPVGEQGALHNNHNSAVTEAAANPAQEPHRTPQEPTDNA